MKLLRLTASNGSGGSGLLSASDAIRASQYSRRMRALSGRPALLVLHPYGFASKCLEASLHECCRILTTDSCQRWTLAQQDPRTSTLVSAQQPWLPDVEPAEMEKAHWRAINQVALPSHVTSLACRFQ